MRMARCIALLVVSLSALTFLIGCPGPENASAEPNESEPNAAEAGADESAGCEVNAVGVGVSARASTEPNAAVAAGREPNAVDSNAPRPGATEPNLADANEGGATAVEPNVVEPNDPGAGKTDPNDPNAWPGTAFHDKCAALLKEFVDDKGRVDYASLKRKRLELKKVLGEFAALDPNEYKAWPRQDKIALWINASNLQMLDIIVRHYPIEPISRFHSVIWGPKSVRHIEGKWTKFKFMVADEVFTLSEIEQRFFRKEFRDPRVFLALTRASVSSPPLRNEPYYGYKLDEQLDDQARRFLSSPLALKIDRDKGKVYISAIFQKNDYGREFLEKYAIDRKFKGKEPETRAVLNFITNYVPESVKSYLELGNYTVQFIGYNWTINDTP